MLSSHLVIDSWHHKNVYQSWNFLWLPVNVHFQNLIQWFTSIPSTIHIQELSDNFPSHTMLSSNLVVDSWHHHKKMSMPGTFFGFPSMSIFRIALIIHKYSQNCPYPVLSDNFPSHTMLSSYLVTDSWHHHKKCQWVLDLSLASSQCPFLESH